MRRPLGIIAGAWKIPAAVHGAPDSTFAELCRFDAEGIDRPAQASLSVSSRGTVRGIHYAAGQAKYVTCVSGAVLDVVVDLRVDSPTFGRWKSVRLDDVTRSAVYLSEGLGHGYCVLSEQATLLYLVSQVYDPAAERGVHPLDPDIGIVWPAEYPDLSRRDWDAPMLSDALAAGLLPGTSPRPVTL